MMMPIEEMVRHYWCQLMEGKQRATFGPNLETTDLVECEMVRTCGLTLYLNYFFYVKLDVQSPRWQIFRNEVLLLPFP